MVRPAKCVKSPKDTEGRDCAVANLFFHETSSDRKVGTDVSSEPVYKRWMSYVFKKIVMREIVVSESRKYA